MRFRAKWILLLTLAALFAAIAGAVFWAERGPGLDGEAEKLARLVNLRPGTTGAEIGAGKGHMAVRLATSLGPSGRLFATEMGTVKLDAIRNRAAAAGLAQVVVLEAGEHSANLPEACCDFIYMRRVYHHLADAAAVTRTIHAALRPGGRLAVIDMISPQWLFFLRHGIAPEDVQGQLLAAGFTLERRLDRWSLIDYCLLFRKL